MINYVTRGYRKVFLIKTNVFRGGCMRKKILIIEDNAENMELFCTVLKCGGYEPLQARNGMEGVKVAMEAQPHLILMDIQMPVMNGYDAIKILKRGIYQTHSIYCSHCRVTTGCRRKLHETRL